MKKLLISFLTGAVLIGAGIGMLFIEISEYSSIDINPEIANSKLNMQTITYSESELLAYLSSYEDYNTDNFDHDNFDYDDISYRISDNFYYASHKPEIIVKEDTTIKNVFEVDVYYRGKSPDTFISLYDYYPQEYSSKGTAVFKLNTFSNFSPKEFFDQISYMTNNKVIIQDFSNFVIEKLVVRTSMPETFSLQ